MKLVCISDTHNNHHQINIPYGDVLIHAGDITYTGEIANVLDFLYWLNDQPHKNKIFIAGNHDGCLQDYPELMADAIAQFPSITYLQDSSVEIDGVKFYGSPWVPRFGDWWFNLASRYDLKEKWDLIPNDTDVLITHTPSFCNRDINKHGMCCGCEELAYALHRVKPKVHVCGHIHEDYGEKYLYDIQTIVVNACINTGNHQPLNKPIVLDI